MDRLGNSEQQLWIGHANVGTKHRRRICVSISIPSINDRAKRNDGFSEPVMEPGTDPSEGPIVIVSPGRGQSVL